MKNLIIAALTAVIAILNNLVIKLLVDVEYEAIDVELEPATDNRIIFSFAAIDAYNAARVADWTIDTSIEVVETEVVNFDYSSIIAALGLATPSEVVEVVETVEEVEAAVVAPAVETVTVLGIEYAIRHMTNVDVSFSGRSISRFNNVEGYLFEGSNGTSDFLIRVQAPLSLSNAKEWMSRNNDARYFTTKVVVTPTVTKFI